MSVLAACAPTASASPSAPRFLIDEAQCSPSAPAATLRSQILAQPGVAAVDFLDGANATPPVAQLSAYDVVVAMGDCNWDDAVALGDNLAAYQDQGGVVVAATFSWQGSGPGSDNLAGRWIDAAYSPYQDNAPPNFGDTTLGTHDASSPLLAGVTSLAAQFVDTMALNPDAAEVAQWSDGTSAIAVKGRAVGINAYIGENDGGFSTAWSGDFGRVIYNAAPKPSGDFTAKVKGKKLLATVADPGSVAVSDAAAPLSAATSKKKRILLLKSSRASGNPPTITVPLRLTKHGKQILRLKGKVKVKARVTYTPQRGTANTKTLKLKIKGKKK
jgi:hypothetical protein